MFNYDIRLAGAQIPVSTDIEYNKREILKSIDWAKENEVNHLLTPEASLSGYGELWRDKIEQLESSLKEIEEHAKSAGIYLHLGTNFQEKESFGKINRNEIRHYDDKGGLLGVTYKTYGADYEVTLPRKDSDPLVIVPTCADTEKINNRVSAIGGMICRDICGYLDGKEFVKTPLHMQYKRLNCVDVLFHATNGTKHPEGSLHQEVFDLWHEAFFRMTAYESSIPILTVDSCTPWYWDETSEIPIDAVPTASQSGFMDFSGWRTDIPRCGRQYFYYDMDVSMTPEEKVLEYTESLQMFTY